jgi:hypothetical protein
MTAQPPPPDRRRPLSEREFNLACEVYARTGSKAAAILSIAGGATDSAGRPSRRRTLEEALRANPEWAQRWEEARTLALGLVEAEIAKAALTVDERPIFDKSGKLLGVQKDSRPRNDMLKFLARKLDPDAWSEKRQLQMSGTVEHKHGPADGFGVLVAAEDVLLLEGEDRTTFIRLLALIRDRRTPENPDVIDQPATRPIRRLDSGSEGDAPT